jgi:hypothetical protein
MMLTALALFLAWEVITRSLTSYLAVASPETAIRLRPTYPTALVTLADVTLNPESEVVEPDPATPHDKADTPSSSQNLDPGDRSDQRITASAEIESAQIRSWAELALRNDPLNARALRILGQLAQRNSDEAHANALMQAAARRSIHESLAVYWMIRKSYEDGDYRAAVHYADTLLRTRTNALELVMPMFAKMAETPQAGVELKQLLAGGPPWRRQFFKQLPDSVSDARTPLDIFLALRTSPFPPTAADLSSYLEFLVRHEFYDLAYYTWLQFLPDDQLDNTGRLYNGRFDVTPSGLPFDWVFTEGAGVTINIASRPEKGGGHALFMEFGPGRVDFGGVTQLVLLAPGTYKFRGRYKANIISERGLEWRIICAPNQDAVIGQSNAVRGSAPAWNDFEFSFTVPETECAAQYVKLALDARSESEKLVSGSIWYGDLSIMRDPASNQNPQ